MRSSLLAFLFVVGACRSDDPPAAVSTEVAAPPASSVKPPVAPVAPGPRASLWPDGKAAPSPLAERLCKAVHDVPNAARAKCCEGSPAISFTDECVRLTSFALADATISIDAAALERCEKDSAVAFAGCDWVAPQRTRPVPSCLDLVRGRVAVDGACRSSLECTRGLHCAGLTPNAPGKCRPPSAVGQACSSPPDVLASVSRQAEPAICDGFCAKRRCVAGTTVADGAACDANTRCGPRSFCDAGKCVPARSRGEPCANPQQCEATCVDGVCGPQCQVVPRDKPKVAP